MTSQGRVDALIGAVRAYVEHQRELGVEGFPSGVAPCDATVATPVVAAVPAPVPAAPVPAAATSTPDADVAGTESLPALRTALGDCQRCKLASGRTNLVFGVGDPHARLVFVGEGPGADEDARGEPFVGRAGQLLTEIITKGMRLRREDVYICNVVKCRPPGNRNPEPDEVAACAPFLHRQIELVAPEVIVALGRFAVQTLLDTKTPISQLRGVWSTYRGVAFMPTFHPAYLLRNPGEKRLVWQDIQAVMQRLGLEVPGR